MEELKKALFALVAGVVTVWSYVVPDAPDFANPTFARVFFWHFPCPMMAIGLLFAAVWSSYRYLAGPSARLEAMADSLPGRAGQFVRTLGGGRVTDRMAWDVRAAAALEMGVIFCALTLFSGILFSKLEWGAWWSNDPRQTSFLLASLLYAAYFAIRAAFPDPEKRAANSAAYLFASLLPILFLTFVLPRLPQIMSLHPSSTIMQGRLHGGYLYVTLAMLGVVGTLTVWLYRLRVRAGLLLLRESDGKLDLRRPAGPRVVARPVPLPSEGGADG